MGEESSEKRTADTLAMLDYGFNMYNIDTIVKRDKSLGKVRVNLGDKEYADIVSKKDISILNNSQNEKRNITYEIKTNKLVAPVRVGDTIGKISIYEDGTFKYDVLLTVSNNVNKANIIKTIIRNLRDMFSINVS